MHVFTTRSNRALCSAFLAAALPATLMAQGQFVELPPGEWTADAVSDDGTVVTGSGANGVFRWTAAGGTSYLGLPSSATDLSADGAVVMANMAASVTPGALEEAAYWTQSGGWVGLLGLIGNSCTGSLSSGSAISKNGQTIVGLGWANCNSVPFRWTAPTGMVELSVFGEDGRANAVSGDGAVVGGWDAERDSSRRAAVWFPIGTSYLEILLIPPTAANPDGFGEVFGMNHTGSVIVGSENGGEAWRWKDGVFKSLGAYPGAQAGDYGAARATNADGSMIVGVSGSALNGFGPFVWTEEDGMQKLINFLADQGISIPSGPALSWVSDISPSGYHIVGRRGAPGNARTFRVELPAGVRYGTRVGGNNTMRLSGTGDTALGGTLTVTTDRITSSNPLVTLIGARSARLPLFGGTLLVDPSPPLVPVPGVPSSGTSAFSITVPQVPALVGASVYLQSVILEPSARRALLSNGIKVTVTN